jgi:hypothetical protein
MTNSRAIGHRRRPRTACEPGPAGQSDHHHHHHHASAEARAFACCVVEWLNRNPVRSPPGRCLGCGAGDHAHDKLLPFGTEQTGHAWLHSRCWPAWRASRKVEAVAALSIFGICMRTLP